MDPEAALLAAIVAQPDDAFIWLALADCLEEQGRLLEAELTRLREWLRHASPRARGFLERESRLQELLKQGVRPVVPERTFPLGYGEALTFCFIPPGKFLMGSPLRERGRYDNEGPRHPVRLTRGFWLGRTTLTNEQWHVLTTGNPATTRENLPVTSIPCSELLRICVVLGRRFGEGFRLPTEAEWEYACRGGTRSGYSLGGTDADAELAGWHSPQAERRSQPIAQKCPNPWGLYDVHGNVWEWCLDARRPYSTLEVIDPAHELFATTARTLRGGSFENRPSDSRSACRGWANPDESATHWGARLAISLDRNDLLLSVLEPFE